MCKKTRRFQRHGAVFTHTILFFFQPYRLAFGAAEDAVRSPLELGYTFLCRHNYSRTACWTHIPAQFKLHHKCPGVRDHVTSPFSPSAQLIAASHLTGNKYANRFRVTNSTRGTEEERVARRSSFRNPTDILFPTSPMLFSFRTFSSEHVDSKFGGFTGGRRVWTDSLWNT